LPGKSSAAISRIIKRLRTHGLIKKVRNSYKYYLTSLGKSAIVAGLKIKNMLLTAEFSGFSTVEAFSSSKGRMISFLSRLSLKVMWIVPALESLKRNSMIR